MLIAWSELGLASAVIILIGAVIINIFAENVLFPQAAGKGLRLSPTVVFVSLVVWGFVLGSLGALLAVPLTLALMMFLQYFDETRWISTLLGSSVRRPTGERTRRTGECLLPISPDNVGPLPVLFFERTRSQHTFKFRFRLKIRMGSVLP